MFSALGSVLKRFCDNCYCSFAKLCDCSQTHVVLIGKPSEGAQAVVRNALAAQPPDLEQTTKALQDQAVGRGDILLEHATVGTKEQQIDGSREGVVEVARDCLQKLAPQAASHAEKWSRLMAASELAKIDLQTKCARWEPITSKQQEQLARKVEFVSRYGSLAAKLWRQLKEKHIHSVEDLEQLVEEKVITVAQHALFQRALDQSLNLVGCNSFAQASPEVKEVFFAAAEKSGTRLGRLADEFTPWHKEDAAARPAGPVFFEIEADEAAARPAGAYFSQEDDEVVEEHSYVDSLKHCFSVPGQEEKSAILRIQILCKELGIDPTSLPNGNLTREEAARIRANASRLLTLDPFILYLYQAIKDTPNKGAWAIKYGWSYALQQEIQNQTRTYPNFLLGLCRSDRLWDLPLESLMILFNVAKKTTAQERADYVSRTDDGRSKSEADVAQLRTPPTYNRPPRPSSFSARQEPPSGTGRPDGVERVMQTIRRKKADSPETPARRVSNLLASPSATQQ